jgi:ADP-ribose pyrophosphatase YjhB (NUDIX family)
MGDREPLTFRAIETVEARLRRRLSPRALRVAYRLGYMVLRPWWFVTRPRTAGIKAVVRCGDDVLLVRHSYARRDRWDLPGGFLHPGEDPERALRRELAEELGVRPVAARLIAHTPSRYDHKREWLFTFAVDVGGRAFAASEAEIAEARWFARDALPAKATRLARQMSARSDWECWTDGPDDP